ncbi:hypothetical protein [Streptomyces kanasensis]|uniref:hypothetical protein n=1 Tax=Streptomyces kanasensis TaxID=936756 RepID=UPI000B010662|nr:hypothetical protein [Streptomyces kanasensis]
MLALGPARGHRVDAGGGERGQFAERGADGLDPLEHLHLAGVGPQAAGVQVVGGQGGECLAALRDIETSSFQLPLLLAQQGVGGGVRAARDPGLVVDLFQQAQLGQPLPAPAHLVGCHSQPPGQFGLAVLGSLDLGPVELHIHAIQSDGHAFPCPVVV